MVVLVLPPVVLIFLATSDSSTFPVACGQNSVFLALYMDTSAETIITSPIRLMNSENMKAPLLKNPSMYKLLQGYNFWIFPRWIEPSDSIRMI